ncbi:MAG: hypothetical protein ABIZ81_00990, partial [Opitutaceae bacterium]
AVNAQGRKLEDAWAVRNKAMSALVEYASSLQAISDAGRKGAESAKQLADAADNLTRALDVASFGTSAGARLGADTFAYAYGQIAKARAARSLEASMAEVQPAIERIAALFAVDLTALDEALMLANRAERDALADANQSEIGYHRQLVATQRELMGAIRSELGENKRPSALTRVDELNRVTQMLGQADAWNANYENQQSAIAERGRLGHEIISATQAAFADWATAHARLLATVRAKRVPSVSELMEATTRINDLVERYRSL